MVQTDVAEEAQVEHLVQTTLDQFGQVDILVNNAGICPMASWDQTTLESWNRIIEVNLTGAYLCSKAVLPQMRRQKYGRIVFISSAGAFMGSVTGHVAYGGSKHMDKKLDRRSLLIGASVATVATAAVFNPKPVLAAAKSRDPLDFSNDRDNVRAYAKLAGTVEDGQVHYWYRGTIFGVTPDATKTMIGFTGLLKMIWKNLGNGSFHYRNYDLGYFTEPNSDVRIEEFTNPFTGKVNRPIDIKGPPIPNNAVNRNNE